MTRHAFPFAAASLAAVFAFQDPAPAAAQEPAQRPPAQAGTGALRVYLDCSGERWQSHCDGDLYRQEITWVNWVRQPEDAQVHVILTTQDLGGGGDRYVLDFLGRGDMAGMEDEFEYSSSAADVDAETVEGILQTMRLGLVRFAAAAGFGDALEVGAVAAEIQAARAAAEADQPSPEDDPWNFWVFSVDAEGSYSSEDLVSRKALEFGVNANRTTEAWKLNFRAGGEFERERFEDPQEDGSTDVERLERDRWGVSGIAVKTLGDHWGAGTELTANNSTEFNRELLVGIGTGIEYNYFPYAQSNRRSLLARYVVSVERVDYVKVTTFGKLKETLYQHEASLNYDAREPWGDANLRTGINQYLGEHSDAWSFHVGGRVEYRLFRGFFVTLDGEYRKIEDQIHLPEEDLSDFCRFVQCTDLPTTSETQFEVGVRYSFGSIFNNVVNERFRFGIF